MQSDASDGSVDAKGSACIEAGAADSSASLIPLGAYRSCFGSVGKSQEGVSGSIGPLTLTEEQGTLMVDVGNDASAVASGSLAFAPSTANDAVIMPGQTFGIHMPGCTTLTITAGALTLAGDTLLVSLLGEGCGDWISGMLSCTVPTVPTGTIEQPKPCSTTSPPHCVCGEDGWPAFPVGVYGECTAGVPQDAAGKITFTENHGVLVAAFDIPGIAPMESLQFTPTTDKTATVAPSQTLVLTVASEIPGIYVAAPMTIASGSLVVSGSTVFVFLGGSDALGERQELFHCTAGK